MNGLHLDFFTVDGKDSGTVQRPCDGLSPMIIDLQLSGQLTQREAPGPVNVPIWIGEQHWYGDKTLIKSYLSFSGAAGLRLTAAATYKVVCSRSCGLTPSGPNPPFSIRFPTWWFANRPLIFAKVGAWTWYVYARVMVWLWPPSWGGKFTEYYPDGNRMTVNSAYYDRAGVPFFRWWYGQKKVTLECGGGRDCDSGTSGGSSRTRSPLGKD